MAQSPVGFVDQHISIAGVSHRYVVYLPPAYANTRKWPLLVFLNGRGECGTDGRRQAEVGLGAAIRKQPDRWPFVVVFPQKPDKSTQWEDHEDLVLAVTAKAEADYAIDAKRRFLTGLSQGGAGSWALGAKHADRWAAVAPVCGYRMHELPLANLRQVPVWAFHGDADKAVPVAQSRELCALLGKAGGSVHLSIYAGVGHNSWDRAYQQSSLAEWFLAAAESPVLAGVFTNPTRVDTVRIHFAVSGARSGSEIERAGFGLRINASKHAIEVSRGSADTEKGELSTRFSAGSLASAKQWSELAEAGPVVVQTLTGLVRSPVWRRMAAKPDASAGDERVQLSVEVEGADGKWQGSAVFAGDEAGLPAVIKALHAVRERVLRTLK